MPGRATAGRHLSDFPAIFSGGVRCILEESYEVRRTAQEFLFPASRFASLADAAALRGAGGADLDGDRRGCIYLGLHQLAEVLRNHLPYHAAAECHLSAV